MLDIVQVGLLVCLLGLVWQGTSPSFGRKTAKKLLLDPHGLIDGRIVPLSRLGFVPDELVVPGFVLHELQLWADGAEVRKRAQARKGLETVKALQAIDTITVTIDRTALAGKHATDDKLVALAKKLGMPLYTTDEKLQKVAEIESVRVLNINDLAQQIHVVPVTKKLPTTKPGQKTAAAKEQSNMVRSIRTHMTSPRLVAQKSTRSIAARMKRAKMSG